MNLIKSFLGLILILSSAISSISQNWECGMDVDSSYYTRSFYELAENPQCDDYLHYIPGYLTHENQSKILTINLTVLVQYYGGDTLKFVEANF